MPVTARTEFTKANKTPGIKKHKRNEENALRRTNSHVPSRLSGVPRKGNKKEAYRKNKQRRKDQEQTSVIPPPPFGKMFLLNENEESPKDILLNELKYKIRVLAGVVFVIRTIPTVLSLFSKSAD
ncbi:Uncharacterized protein PCOAH_00017490 [Plasmodium coatneyi]|uniref:Uncharacterized protein n=1 Tax=Plasmodium coatneyi TaxID=208452 RepID=A0A1B1DXP3_9APIC|nr:Uncharacterized protein PCOAH_00017490 [Plasmodium coatneyi]ANQ07399.1 Uncharacterized protein PCOAH_00017490 [Plasmodium coatneyi]